MELAVLPKPGLDMDEAGSRFPPQRTIAFIFLMIGKFFPETFIKNRAAKSRKNSQPKIAGRS
jgi:hypothetical protein